MHNDYKTLFATLSPAEPPQRLYGAICARIERQEKRAAGIRAIALGIVTCLSLGIMVPVIQNIMWEFSRSGFLRYLSLFITDGVTVLAYWKEFSMLLVESLPFAGIIVLLSLVLTFLGSLRSAARNTRIALSHSHLIS